MEGTNPPKLLDQVRQKIQFLHYFRKTEQSYIHWIRRFILFHNKCHPKDMGGDEVAAFLNFLANKENVAASTQNQGLAAHVFLYKHILDVDVSKIPDFQYAQKPKRLPAVLTQGEIKRVFEFLNEPYLTMVGLMYGSGLRLNEYPVLRMLDVDYDIRTVQELMGHTNVNTTMIYTHVLNKGGHGVKSPLDSL